jgi:adenylyltransferase/sulfurtransferase
MPRPPEVARALLIGAGGLGCAAALGLAAGGLRRLTVVDDDVVDETNLHRQLLHADAPLGAPKAASLGAAIERRFPGVAVEAIRGRFDAGTAEALLSDPHRVDVLIDGSDNLATKFLANDAAVLHRVPLVHGAAVGLGGQLLTVPVGGRPCYRCLFEELPPPDADAPSCTEAGVLGPVPGVIGALQACEALRLLCGQTPACMGRMIRYSSPSLTMRTTTFRRNPSCRVCGDRPSIVRIVASEYSAPAC